MTVTTRLLVLAYTFTGSMLAGTGTSPAAAAQRQPALPLKPVIHSCSFLTQAEIEKVLGGKARFGGPPEESVLPGGGVSDCAYASAIFQADPLTWSTLERDVKAHQAEWKPLPGVGDAAYLTINTSDNFVGVYARAGQHTVTVRIDTDEPPTTTPEKARTAAIALAQALIAKLR